MRDRLIELIRKQRKLCNDKNCGSCGYAKFGGYHWRYATKEEAEEKLKESGNNGNRLT